MGVHEDILGRGEKESRYLIDIVVFLMQWDAVYLNGKIIIGYEKIYSPKQQVRKS
jgi:hypothetical protein